MDSKRWEVRIGSPRELFWKLSQLLLDMGYNMSGEPYEPLKLKPTPIEGHATFDDRLRGSKSLTKASLWQFILGVVLLCVAFGMVAGLISSGDWWLLLIAIPTVAFGIYFIRRWKYTLVRSIYIRLEGETYRATARSQEPHKPQSEVLDTTSNARVVLDYGLCRKGTKGQESKPSDQEWQKFEADLQKIEEEVNRLIHSIELPKVSG